MANPSKILAVVPDGRTGARNMRFLLDDIPNADWISLFYRAFGAAASDDDPPVAVTDDDGNAVFVDDDPDENNDRLFNLVDFSGDEADPDHDDYEPVQGWNKEYRENPAKGMVFEGAFLTIAGLDPTKQFTTGTYDDSDPPELQKEGVVDIVERVVEAVGLTDDTAGNYALSLHKQVTDAEGLGILQDKFDG